MKRDFSILGMLVMGLCLLAPSHATAEIVTIEFEADIMRVGINLEGAFEVGDQVSGVFSYDSDETPYLINPTSPIAWYDAIDVSDSVGVTLSYTIGDYEGYALVLKEPSAGLGVYDNFETSSVSDRFVVGSPVLTGPVDNGYINGMKPDHVRFQLYDPTATVFDDHLSLPTALDFADFDLENTSLNFFALNFSDQPGLDDQIRAKILLGRCYDEDGDGYGYPADDICDFPQLDCNDSDPDINPGMYEVPGNGLNDDCNGATPSYPQTANTMAAAYGPSSLIGSGMFNALTLVFVPIGAVIAFRFLRRKK